MNAAHTRVGTNNEGTIMGLILWIVAVVLVIAGAVQLMQGQLILGLILIVAGLAVGPGGWTALRPGRA